MKRCNEVWACAQQLTHRRSSRDLVACLAAVPAKLYHSGFSAPIHYSTLAAPTSGAPGRSTKTSPSS